MRKNNHPGFALTLGYTLLYLSLIVIIPLAALTLKSTTAGPAHFFSTITDPRVVASLKLSFSASLFGAFLNVIFGFITAWTLVRYNFPGRRILDAMVDLPFAIPTAVSGIALTAVYSQNGPAGSLLEKFGIKAAYNETGIIIALTFIGLPFVVRTVQPVLEELDRELEEAAESLGANRWQVFTRILLPSLYSPILIGFALAFSRAVGEYGSVIFIAGNMPFRTEITSLLIITKLEQYDYSGATAIAVVMLLVSFGVLFLINFIQHRIAKRQGI